MTSVFLFLFFFISFSFTTNLTFLPFLSGYANAPHVHHWTCLVTTCSLPTLRQLKKCLPNRGVSQLHLPRSVLQLATIYECVTTQQAYIRHITIHWRERSLDLFFRGRQPFHPDTKVHTTRLHTAASSRTNRTSGTMPATGDNQPEVKQACFPTRDRVRGRGGERAQGPGTERLAMLSIYTCRAEHQSLEDIRQGDDALYAGALIHHHQPMHLEENTERWTWYQSEVISRWLNVCTPVCVWKKSHFSFDYSVHNGLHRLHFVALHDSFEVLRAMFQSLRHCDVQVVVRLLSSQVLWTNVKTLWQKTTERFILWYLV